MKTTEYINLLQNSQNISSAKTLELEAIVNDFPYFQSARVLYLKGLKQQESIHYNLQLKKTAAYTTDRSVLFNFITSEIFINQTNKEEKNIISKIKAVDAKVVKELHKKINKQQSPITLISTPQEAKQILKIDQPFLFNSKEAHSFNQWLQLSAKLPIKRDKATNNKATLINNFIKKRPKINPIKEKENNTPLTTLNKSLDNALMTETLAKIYVVQQKYENAISAYRILCLKYPEKSGFFADRIKAIELLQKNKS